MWVNPMVWHCGSVDEEEEVKTESRKVEVILLGNGHGLNEISLPMIDVITLWSGKEPQGTPEPGTEDSCGEAVFVN